MDEFERLCVQAAGDIRGGSLKLPPQYSQVGEASWELLADINATGLLTNNSQAGEDADERAYVCGFMPTREAYDFAQRMNMVGDFVAFCVEPTEDIFNGFPVTRRSAPYDEFLKNSQTSGSDRYRAMTRQHMCRSEELQEMEMEVVGIDEPWLFREVVVFDPRWGRPGYEEGGLFAAVLECLKDRIED